MERAGTELASENPAIPSASQDQFAGSDRERKVRGAFELQRQKQFALNHFQPLEFDRKVLLSSQRMKGMRGPGGLRIGRGHTAGTGSARARIYIPHLRQARSERSALCGQGWPWPSQLNGTGDTGSTWECAWVSTYARG